MPSFLDLATVTAAALEADPQAIAAVIEELMRAERLSTAFPATSNAVALLLGLAAMPGLGEATAALDRLMQQPLADVSRRSTGNPTEDWQACGPEERKVLAYDNIAQVLRDGFETALTPGKLRVCRLVVEHGGASGVVILAADGGGESIYRLVFTTLELKPRRAMRTTEITAEALAMIAERLDAAAVADRVLH